MKRSEAKSFLSNVLRRIGWLSALFMLGWGARLEAESFTNLYTFSGGNDGGSPAAGVILAGTNLYGTTESGGVHGYGGVFVMSTNGGSFTTLHSFSDAIDGAYPVAGLVLAGTNLYGVAEAGGVDSAGVIFRVGANGGGFTNLYSFTGGNDGANPHGRLILVGTNLYGTANDGGSFGYGTIFRIGTNGLGFTNLYSFTGNSDGANPEAGLTLAGTNLFGTAEFGGNPNVGFGTVFRLSVDGVNFAVRHTFVETDGANPQANLVLAGTNLYGAASSGGLFGNGALFAQSIAGTNFSILHSFSSTAAPIFGGVATNADGTTPRGLVVAGTNLFGVAEFGGLHGGGTVFAADLVGTNITILHALTGADGAEPADGLYVSNNIIYGTGETGGNANAGTVFTLNLSRPMPAITGIQLMGNSLVVSGTGNSAGSYVWLTSTNADRSPGQWTPVQTNVITAGGSFSITNAASRAQTQIYYLLQTQ